MIQEFRRRQGLPSLPWRGVQARKQTPAQLQAPAVLHLFSQHVLKRPKTGPPPPRSPASASALKESRNLSTTARSPTVLGRRSSSVLCGIRQHDPRNPHELASIVIEATLRTNQRLILNPGWGRVLPKTALPPSVFVVEECPHAWLFPKCEGPCITAELAPQPAPCGAVYQAPWLPSLLINRPGATR